MLVPTRLQRCAEAGLHVAGQVEIHQAVGGADLHFGIVVARGLHQRVEAALRADLGDLFDRLDADVEVRVLQQLLEPRDGVRAAFADFADVFGR